MSRLLSLVPALVLAAPALAQESDAQVRADIAFARGLAADWGFTDLSEEVLATVEANAPKKMATELGLVKCQIFHAGAKSERRDALRRHELYQKALESYEAFIDEFPYDDLSAQAETEFVEVTSEFGRSLAREMEEATGEEAIALREELQQRLTAAVVRTGDLAEGLRAIEEPTEAEKAQLYKLLLNRGNMLLEIAKTQEDGEFNYTESLSTYEELAFVAGESSPWGLQAYVGMGNNYLAQGEYVDAADFFMFVCEQAMTKDPERREEWLAGELDWQDGQAPSAAELEQRFLFVQLGITGTVEALRKAGDLASACDWGLYFYSIYKGEGLTLHESGLGHQALLAVGQTLLEAGGYVGGLLNDGEGKWFPTREEMEAEFTRTREQRSAAEVALGIAEQVNQEMRGNVLQIRAQKLIAEVIELPGMEADPEILFQAAQGEYYSNNSPEAIDGFKRLLAMLEGSDQATRTEFGTRTLYFLGKTYRRDGLHLQAVATYQEALDNWPEDPEFTKACANDMLASAGSLRRIDKQDPFYETLYKEAENWVLTIGGDDTEDIKFRNALSAYEGRDPDFQAVMAMFQDVGPESSSYEKARVYVATCAWKLKDFTLAEKLFDEYLNDYVQDPKNAVASNRQRARRTEAMAMARLYWGFNAIAVARLGDGNDPEQWRKVVTVLDGYEDEFPEQSSYASVAMYRRMMALLTLGEIEQALAVQTKLFEQYPEERSSTVASQAAYKVLLDQREGETDEAARRELLEKMARLLQIGNKGASQASWSNLRNESSHWLDLEQYAKAELPLRKLIEAFADDEDHGDSVTLYVTSDLGLALMMQEKTEEAAAILAPLVESGSASLEASRNYALCLTGWVEFEEGGARIVPGVAEDAESFDKAIEQLVKIVNTTGAREKWTDPWYQAKFDLSFGYLRYSEIDSAKKESAEGQLSNVLPDLGGESFTEIETESMRDKWKWLWKQVR